MIGHEPLWQLRRKGLRPVAVWVGDTDAPMAQAMARNWPMEPNMVTGALMPELVLDAHDRPEALDLRCLVGLVVHVSSGRSDARCKRIFEAVKAAQPAIAVAVFDAQVHVYRRQ